MFRSIKYPYRGKWLKRGTDGCCHYIYIILISRVETSTNISNQFWCEAINTPNNIAPWWQSHLSPPTHFPLNTRMCRLLLLTLTSVHTSPIHKFIHACFFFLLVFVFTQEVMLIMSYCISVYTQPMDYVAPRLRFLNIYSGTNRVDLTIFA